MRKLHIGRNIIFGKRTLSVLDWDKNSIRIVQGKKTPGVISDVVFEEIKFNISDKNLVSGLIGLSEKYNIKKTELITVLPRSQVFLRKISVPFEKNEEIQEILHYEAEKHLPFPAEEAVIDLYFNNRNEGTVQNEIIIAAAKKELIKKHLDLLSSAGLYPDRVSVSTIALNNLISASELNRGFIALLWFSGNFWEIGIFNNSTLNLSRGFQVSPSDKDNNDIIIREIKNTFISYRSLYPKQEMSNNLYIVNSSGKDIYTDVFEKLKCKITDINTDKILERFIELKDKTKKRLCNCPITLGLLIPGAKSVNLIPKDILEIKKRKKKKKAILSAMGILIILAAAYTGNYLVKNYNKLVKNRDMFQKGSGKEIMALRVKSEYVKAIDRFTADSLLPLSVLMELSKNMPGNTYIIQLNYDYKEKSVLIKGRANSYETASKVAEKLNKSQSFRSVKSKGVYSVKLENISLVDFELDCALNTR